MAIPLHLWLKNDVGSDVHGSSQVVGRENSIEILSFAHGMTLPADSNTGRLMGGRLHRPVVIEKEIDRASPALYMSLARGLTLQSAEIRWYRTSEAGREEPYFNMLMKNVKVVSVSPRVPNIKEQASTTRNHFEQVEFRYESIEWSYLDGNITFRDSWNELSF